MIPVAFVALALVVLFREWLLEQALRLSESGRLPKIDSRQAVAAVLLAAAAASWFWQPKAGGDAPPPPPPAGPIVLAGKFVGDSAPEDAVALAGLCSELADCVEHDGAKPEPRLTTGVAIDDLRMAARDGRLRGGSIGDRHPLVRQAIHEYLDRPDVLGPAGGPLSPEHRIRWVDALRTISRAAEAAVR